MVFYKNSRFEIIVINQMNFEKIHNLSLSLRLSLEKIQHQKGNKLIIKDS